ncbi:hypothetical protein ACFYPC_08955 [Streptomyces sp. NPDC005808]|uniref:hypothetical protein n=1 Tax=Streptomyces sp. NPDC005808 TaxID=3364734 RepID=UPI0036911E53
MTPLERLLLEEIPVRPESASGGHGLWTKQEQDRHWDDLAAAIGAAGTKRPAPPSEAAA